MNDTSPRRGPLMRFFVGVWDTMNFTRRLIFNLVFFGFLLFFLAALVPSIALGVRRLHDTDNSGLLHLLSLIPYAGVVVQAVLMAQPSSPNGMRYDKVNRR